MEELFRFFSQVNALIGIAAVVVVIVLTRWKVPQLQTDAFSRSLKEHREMLKMADEAAAAHREQIKQMQERIAYLEARDTHNREASRQTDAALMAYKRYTRSLENCCRGAGGELPAKDELLKHIEETL